MAWLPDGRLAFTSTASGLPQIWIMDGDGQNQRQVTSLTLPATRTVAPADNETTRSPLNTNMPSEVSGSPSSSASSSWT